MSDEESEIFDERDTDEQEFLGDHAEEDLFSWNLVNNEILDDPNNLSAEEMLGEDFEREAANFGVLASIFEINSFVEILQQKTE